MFPFQCIRHGNSPLIAEARFVGIEREGLEARVPLQRLRHCYSSPVVYARVLGVDREGLEDCETTYRYCVDIFWLEFVGFIVRDHGFAGCGRPCCGRSGGQGGLASVRLERH